MTLPPSGRPQSPQDDGLVPAQLPSAIICSRDDIRQRAAEVFARWGKAGPVAQAYRWALRGEEVCPVSLSYWSGGAPSRADIENEAMAPSRWGERYGGEVAIARLTLWWLTHDLNDGWPAGLDALMRSDGLSGRAGSSPAGSGMQIALPAASEAPSGPDQPQPGGQARQAGRTVRKGRLWLDVPYDDRLAAKAAGARWDPSAKRWYAPRAGIQELRWWEPLPQLLPGEDRSFGSGLFVDLIPQSCWFSNVRTCVRPESWKRVRTMVYGRAENRCETCGRAADKAQGVWMEAHERWEYLDEAGIQRLRRLVCLCSACHSVTHFGLASKRGEGDAAFGHLLAVTGMTEAEGERHIEEAFARWRERSDRDWELDLSMLSGFGLRLVREAAQAREERT
jgi:Domain of unknown function (DUF5710)